MLTRDPAETHDEALKEGVHMRKRSPSSLTCIPPSACRCSVAPFSLVSSAQSILSSISHRHSFIAAKLHLRGSFDTPWTYQENQLGKTEWTLLRHILPQ
jgi:hypothetical protein